MRARKPLLLCDHPEQDTHIRECDGDWAALENPPRLSPGVLRDGGAPEPCMAGCHTPAVRHSAIQGLEDALDLPREREVLHHFPEQPSGGLMLQRLFLTIQLGWKFIKNLCDIKTAAAPGPSIKRGGLGL